MSSSIAQHHQPASTGLRRALADVFESFRRVARKTDWPGRAGFLQFLGDQLLLNGVSWTAGLLAVWLVRSLFEVRSFRNLWGLTADRTLVSEQDYQLLVNVASYTAGLVMLIAVRHLVLRVVSELYLLRLERGRGVVCRSGE
jgi:hypothetical protein